MKRSDIVTFLKLAMRETHAGNCCQLEKSKKATSRASSQGEIEAHEPDDVATIKPKSW